MDWKPYYRRELEEEATQTGLRLALREAERERTLDAQLERGAILSFPHTAARYAGPIQARVVAALYRRRPRLVVALGVLHLSGAPTYRAAVSPEEPAQRRAQAFAALAGAFVGAETDLGMPFGRVSLAPLRREVPGVLRRDRGGVLKDEFSLDLFLALVRLQATLVGAEPLPVLPLFVGMTRDPQSGSFDHARELAAAIVDLAPSGAVLVTTGDLVHFGRTYDPEDRIQAMPQEPADLASFFRRETEQALDLALAQGDLTGAFDRSERILHNDQRFVLPVLAEILAPRGTAQILEFELSDYSSILRVEPPAVVASALVAYGRAA